MCTNRLVVPIEVADRAVLTAIEHDVMRPEIVETALADALETLRPSGAEVAERRQVLEGELAELEEEIARYARAVADGGRSPLSSQSYASVRRGATTSWRSSARSRAWRALLRLILHTCGATFVSS